MKCEELIREIRKYPPSARVSVRVQIEQGVTRPSLVSGVQPSEPDEPEAKQKDVLIDYHPLPPLT